MELDGCYKDVRRMLGGYKGVGARTPKVRNRDGKANLSSFFYKQNFIRIPRSLLTEIVRATVVTTFL
jgi:hypothetical protein